MAEVTIVGEVDQDSLVSLFAGETSLPQGRVIRTPEPEPDKPQDMMIALRIAPEVSGRYWVDDGDPLPLDERHITLVYFGQLGADERAKVHDVTRRWLVDADWQAMDGRAQGWGTFNNNSKVLWMSWDIPGLSSFREDLVQTLGAHGLQHKDNHGFVPHETVTYYKTSIHAIPPFPGPPPTQTFTSVVVAEGDLWTEYDFPSAHGRGLVAALLAAGKKKNKDGNEGNAAELKKYWTTGEGGLKIKWGTGGDHERCVKHLKKYLGPGANGYCQNLHKIMTGMYTGDMKHRIMYGWGGKPGSYWAKKAAEDKKAASLLRGLLADGDLGDGVEEMLELLGGDMEVTDVVPDDQPMVVMLQPTEQRFRIPVLLPEGVESGDGRTFEDGVISWRVLPLPLLWQPNTMNGHDNSLIVGRIDSIERIEGGVGNATGVFDTSPMALEAVRMIRNGFLRGVSADLDRFEARVRGKGPGTGIAKDADEGDAKDGDKPEKNVEDGDDEVITTDKMDITKGRIMAATLVAKPAFEECRIELMEPEMIADGEYRIQIGPDESLASVIEAATKAAQARPLTASFNGAPIYPPQSWFSNPNLSKPSRITITDEGQVFGHIAAWHVDHIGMGFGVRPPKSKSGYAYFQTGIVRTEEGDDVRVGQLTLVGGHASITADVKQTVKHYDDTASAWADVVAGEDQFGIWVAGALRPTVTPEQLRSARASAVSGDWRPINGRLELVAVCSVNVPGFPMVEARVASGQVMALVAAGTAPLAQDWARALTEMLLEDRVASLRTRVIGPREEQQAQLSAEAVAARARVLSRQPVSQKRRADYAKRGLALPDGSYPIADEADLKRAISAYGRSKPADRKKVRAHIIKRAKALGKSDLIPANWK